jgi:dihydropyrimidinase
VTYNLVIHGGLLVGSTTEGFAHVGACGEQIAAIGLDLGDERQIDATGLYKPPGAIDGHVHLTYPISATERTADSCLTGTCAAAFSGVTTLLDFRSRRLMSRCDSHLAHKRFVKRGYEPITNRPAKEA